MQWYQIQELLLGTTVALAVLIPVLGLTVRFSLGPLIDKFARLRATQTEDMAREVGELKGEVTRLRRHVAELETDLHRLAEVREFDRRLANGE